MNSDSLYEKIQACIFGQALGDALGYAVEFDDRVNPLNPKVLDIRDVSGDNVAAFSDDTQMAYSVALGLLDAGVDADPDIRQIAVARRLIEWEAEPLGGSHRAPGGTCLRGVRRLRGLQANGCLSSALDRDHTVEEKGCGVVMRSAPIGWFFPPEQAAEVGADLAAHTHSGACAKAQGAVMSGMISHAIWTSDIASAEPAITTGIEIARQYDRETRDMLFDALACASEFWAILADSSRDYEEREVVSRRCDQRVLDKYRGWRGDEALAAAAYCLLTTGDTKSCVLKAANSPGDSDSIAAVAGAVAGILWGVPNEWVAYIEEREKLDDLSKKATSAIESKIDIYRTK